MPIRGFKTPLKENGSEIDGYLVGFTGESLIRLQKLKESYDLKEEQDVISLALLLLERATKEDEKATRGTKKSK